MLYLILGLLAFLGLHSVRIFAPAWREARVRQWGANGWKGIYSLLAIAGFALLVWGYGQARAAPVVVWVPPLGLRHLAALLTLPAFVLLVAAYVPANHLKARLGHPMLLGIKLWAFAHLLVSGWLHAMVLAGAFLLWAILCFRSARRRPAATAAAPRVGNTVLAVVIGVAAWAGFAFWGHRWLIGVSPFG